MDTDLTVVLLDKQQVDVEAESGWSCGYCFKEVVIQYKLEGTQPTPREILTRDTSWVSVVWNNARKRYRVFLKNVDTTQQTFRFYVFEDDALDTFIEKARSNMKLLQTDMLEHTHLDGLEFTVLLSTTKTWQIYDGSECLLDRVTRTPDQQQASLKSHGSIRQTETSSIDSGISFRSQRSSSLREHPSVYEQHPRNVVIGTNTKGNLHGGQENTGVHSNPEISLGTIPTDTVKYHSILTEIRSDCRRLRTDVNEILRLIRGCSNGTSSRRRVSRKSSPYHTELRRRQSDSYSDDGFRRRNSTSRQRKRPSAVSTSSSDSNLTGWNHRLCTNRRSDLSPCPTGLSESRIIRGKSFVCYKKGRNSGRYLDDDGYTRYRRKEDVSCERSEVAWTWVDQEKDILEDGVDIAHLQRKREVPLNVNHIPKQKCNIPQRKHEKRQPESYLEGADVLNGVKVLDPRVSIPLQGDTSTNYVSVQPATHHRAPNLDTNPNVPVQQRQTLSSNDQMSCDALAYGGVPQQKGDDASALSLGVPISQTPYGDMSVAEEPRTPTNRLEDTTGVDDHRNDKDILEAVIRKMEQAGELRLDTDDDDRPGRMSPDLEVDCGHGDSQLMSVDVQGGTEPGAIFIPSYEHEPLSRSVPGSLIDLDSVRMLQNVGLDPREDLIKVLDHCVQSIQGARREPKGDGVDTVFLVDLSASIDDKSLHQVTSTLLNIIQFIEHVAAERRIDENIAIAVFGKETMILHHLTIAYGNLYDKIDAMEVGGTSPLCLGILLCMMELHQRGGTTSVGGYQIPPRVVILTDGRPTDDSRLYQPEIEFAVKDPRANEHVMLAMDEMKRHNYNIFCVPVGQARNMEFVHELVDRADGRLVELDDVHWLKKYFLYHHTIARVVGICRENGMENQYKEVMKREISLIMASAELEVTFTDADMAIMIDELEKSEELLDIEYPDKHLPSLGSRVTFPMYVAGTTGGASEYGTVIKQMSSGNIKVEWDNRTANILRYSDERRNGLETTLEPRRLTPGSLLDVGVEVVLLAAFLDGKQDTQRGRIFQITNSGFAKVRWKDGSIARYKYGSDATFDIDICLVLESLSLDSYVWQYTADSGGWVTYPYEVSYKIESTYTKKRKTAIINTGRVVFYSMKEHQAKEGIIIKRPVRRVTIGETL